MIVVITIITMIIIIALGRAGQAPERQKSLRTIVELTRTIVNLRTIVNYRGLLWTIVDYC